MRVILFCLLLLFGTSGTIGHSDRPETTHGLTEVVIYPKDYPMMICVILTELGVDKETVKIIIAQAQHESADFTSNIFVENNNCFGMKQARVRPNLAIGTNRGHAVYRTVEEGIIDYYLYMVEWKIPKNEKNIKRYVTLLYKKGYFWGYPDALNAYIKQVRTFHKTINV